MHLRRLDQGQHQGLPPTVPWYQSAGSDLPFHSDRLNNSAGILPFWCPKLGARSSRIPGSPDPQIPAHCNYP
ncbi:hypothetical protein PoB_003030900 [Plakobranchus ocellatus]|uniref:Uncharacterized protein n=1 Tax=Plakobranchus ocellatus TaxID=259542 RepID=A0AAV4ABI8_9GAST|nr:hypothetical protein PoB_003030900 [Plakobranchus ocellatus]